MLSGADRDAIMAAGRRRSVPDGEVLFHQGAVSGRVVVVLSGTIRVTATSAEGRDTTLATVGPGDVVGDLSAVDGEPHSGTAITVGEVEALFLSAAEFRWVVAEHGGVALALLQTLGRRLRLGDRARVEFGVGQVVTRVAALLIRLATDHGVSAPGGGTAIGIASSQEELATWLGTSREAVNKALRRLVALNVVEVGRKRVVITDRARLERLARR